MSKRPCEMIFVVKSNCKSLIYGTFGYAIQIQSNNTVSWKLYRLLERLRFFTRTERERIRHHFLRAFPVIWLRHTFASRLPLVFYVKRVGFSYVDYENNLWAYFSRKSIFKICILLFHYRCWRVYHRSSDIDTFYVKKRTQSYTRQSRLITYSAQADWRRAGRYLHHDIQSSIAHLNLYLTPSAVLLVFDRVWNSVQIPTSIVVVQPMAWQTHSDFNQHSLIEWLQNGTRA